MITQPPRNSGIKNHADDTIVAYFEQCFSRVWYGARRRTMTFDATIACSCLLIMGRKSAEHHNWSIRCTADHYLKSRKHIS
jgi:hypothetical protein